ncbi:MAG: glucosamine inositolphosphorylceramide transferase family protein [Methylocystis sp.]
MTYRRILIIVASSRFMRWHERLRDSLSRRWPDAEVAFSFDPRGDDQPSSVTQLLTLERMLLRRNKAALSDRIPACPTAAPASGADVAIDLIGDAPAAGAARVLRPLYDGHASDQGAVAAILSGAVPALAVEDAATGAVLIQGLPSFEAAEGLTGALESVYSRIGALIERALSAPDGIGAQPAPRIERHPRHPAAFIARIIAFEAARWLYHLCCYSPHWRIGWRLVDGPGVIETGDLSGPRWRALPDQETSFAADPFPIEWRGQTGVFYELLDYRTNTGEIYFQPFDDSGPIGAPVRALKEPWHLSYPFLIEEEGALFMVPEASVSGAITLYRCVDFPTRWEPVAKLVEGVEAADATIFRHGGRYWMTSVVRDGYGGYSDTLAIHHAPSLFGPWEAHALSPVLVDSRVARPAGAVVSRNGVLLRPVQDCSKGYGKGLAIMRIDALDPGNFRQTLVARLGPGKHWPGNRLHSLNRFGRLEVIDGAVITPKYMPLRRALHERIDAHA